jgi:hypothetical protein
MDSLTFKENEEYEVWVINGWALVDSVGARCMECRLKAKKCMEQRMGPLANHRVEVGAMFQSVEVDLFGPIEYQGTVNKRQVSKGWGVVFVCTTTSAVHIEFVDTYSTDSFLLALWRFMCLRGTPTRFQSDRGEQLVAAAKQVSSSDFKEVIQWAGRKGRAEGHRVGPGAHRGPALQRAGRKNDRVDQEADLEKL